jgi:hypothetical protein
MQVGVQVGYIVQPLMPEDSTADVLRRRLPLYAYLERLWVGRRVLQIAETGETGEIGGIGGIGTTGEAAAYLTSLGAARVVTSDGDLTGIGERFDVIVVPEADALVRRPGTVASWRKLLTDQGRLVVAVSNAERPGASGGLGYYELHDAMKPHLAGVQMLGVTPFLGVGVVEFDGAVEALRIDSRLVKEPEPPTSYVAIAGAEPLGDLGYALVQLPYSAAAATAVGASKGRAPGPELTVEQSRKLEDAEAAIRVARAQGDEIEELRGRLRRAAEDRAALDAENAKLRRALAEADESVMNLTRRTTEEMAAVADRLAGLRSPPEADTRARDEAAREEVARLRVKLAETDARAASAEQRLEEIGTASRERQVALDDALERQRLAESELARARREAGRFEAEARAAVVDGRTLDDQARALAARDERIARLEGEKQDLIWRLAELEDKLRQAISRAVQGGVARPEGGLAAQAATSPVTGEASAAVRQARERALEDFHRASSAHVGEITELRASVSEQMALVAELEDAVAAAEKRAASAGTDAATLRKTAKDLEEADRSRRSRLAELEGKLLRLEHERKVATDKRDGSEDAERRRRELETERDDLRARIGVLEANAAGATKPNGHDIGSAIAREMADRNDSAPGSGGPEIVASRLENTLGNYRQRAGRLREDLEGIRRRLDSLSQAELSEFLEELGEDLAELG